MHAGYFAPGTTDASGTTCNEPAAEDHCAVEWGPFYSDASGQWKDNPVPFVNPKVSWKEEKGQLRATFFMVAKFKNNAAKGEKCGCCSVRQKIKWNQKWLDSGGEEGDQVKDNKILINSYPEGIGAGVWREDRYVEFRTEEGKMIPTKDQRV